MTTSPTPSAPAMPRSGRRPRRWPFGLLAVLALLTGGVERWIGRLAVPGVFEGEHSFVITPIGPDRVRLVQEESFRGVAVPFMRGWLGSETLPAFEALNAALRERVETLYP